MLSRRYIRQLPSSLHSLTSTRPVSNTRTLASTFVRFNSSKPQQPSAYRDGLARYRTFAVPFGKVFLGAVFVYQVIYWTWLKLEMDESKFEKNEELVALEKKARELAASQK